MKRDYEKQTVRTTESLIKTIHYGGNKFMNFQYVIDRGDDHYRGMKLLDFEKLCTFCLHEYQDMLGERNSPEIVSHLDLFIAMLEQTLYDDYYSGSDEELFKEDIETLH